MISTFFQACFFFGRTNLKLIEKHDKLLEDPGACFLGKNLLIVMAILVLFD